MSHKPLIMDAGQVRQAGAAELDAATIEYLEGKEYPANTLPAKLNSLLEPSERFKIIYPQGTEDNPFVISSNTRIVTNNPFGDNTSIFCEAQIYLNDLWGNPGNFISPGGLGSTFCGTSAYYIESLNKIIVQTGAGGVAVPLSVWSGSPFGYSYMGALATAKLRVRVWSM